VGGVDVSLAAAVARLALRPRLHSRVRASASSFSWHTDDDGSIVLEIKLSTEDARAVIAAVNANVTPRRGVEAHQARADALVTLCTRTDDDNVTRPEVMVHIEPDRVHFENGPAVTPEIAAMLACDGAVTTVVNTKLGPVPIHKDPAPTRAQRRLLALLHSTCQVDGCDNAGHFDAHHVVERQHGGKTAITNLVRLCRFHHRLVHVLGLRLTLHPDRRLEIHFPAGNPVVRTIPWAPFVAPEPENPEWISGHWCGERLHMDDVHLVVGLLEEAAAATA